MSWVAIGTTALTVAGEVSKAPPIPGGAGGGIDPGIKTYGTLLDGSNWNVNFGGTQTNRQTSTHETTSSDERGNPLTGQRAPVAAAGVSPILLLAGAAGVAFFALRKHH